MVILLLGEKSKSFISYKELLNLSEDPSTLLPLDIYALQPFPRTKSSTPVLYCIRYFTFGGKEAFRITKIKMISTKWVERAAPIIQQESQLTKLCKTINEIVNSSCSTSCMELIIYFNIDLQGVLWVHECTYALYSGPANVFRPQTASSSIYVKSRYSSAVFPFSKMFEVKSKGNLFDKIKKTLFINGGSPAKSTKLAKPRISKKSASVAYPKSALLSISSLELHRREDDMDKGKRMSIQVTIGRPHTSSSIATSECKKVNILMPQAKNIEGRKSFLVAENTNTESVYVQLKARQECVKKVVLKPSYYNANEEAYNNAWKPRKLPKAVTIRSDSSSSYKKTKSNISVDYTHASSILQPKFCTIQKTRNKSHFSNFSRKSIFLSSNHRKCDSFYNKGKRRFLEIEGKTFSSIKMTD